MSVIDDDQRLGARIVALRQSIDAFRHETISLDEYESIILAGRAATLHSEVRRLGSVNSRRFAQYRKLAELQRVQADLVLAILEANGFVSVERSTNGSISKVTATKTTPADSLRAAAIVFRTTMPSPLATAALMILDASYSAPIQRDQAVNSATTADPDIDDEIAYQAIDELAQLKAIYVTLETHQGEPLLANPQSFQQKIDEKALLAAFNTQTRDRALEVLDYINRNPATPLSKEDKVVGDLLADAGLVDYNIVQGHNGEIVTLPTLAATWGTHGGDTSSLSADAIDDGKAFLSTLRYGEFYSEYWRGKIMDQVALLSALINRGTVGPATAIGQDYPLVVARGIINVIEDPNYPGRFNMELRKPEVARSVLEVVKGRSKQNPKMPVEVAGLSMSESYLSPEAGRQRIELPSRFRDEKQAIVFGLLTIRRRNP